ncbi:ABC transporter substrate-binding protein [Ahrensia sp. R2A130]|uniref:taurine ABC transporter substrate-binding protein n=1 Tax=Ahrensia sp. R2A130 TaxID=744979 RepID=UPI0001E0C37C|nr:ABC transporter substrate-binding protein [Ahrensia sp. R2A130]EFL88798.1 taurine ABC transporter, periplasmic binding protein [Ahrensia sp. R2A130]
MKTMIKSVLAASIVAMSATTAMADAHVKELVVGYFLEWPTPNQYAQANELYEKELGIPVKWVSFDAGTAMSAAMASGDVQISFSQGVTPFLVATAAGQDLQAVDIAVSYSDNDNCVVRSELEVNKENAAEKLKGKKVAVPLGTAAHSGFLAQIAYLGINEADLNIVDMSPSDSSAAFAQPSTDLAMVCGWGGSLRKMKEHGNPIIEGAEKEKVVGKVFDITSVPSAFAEENPKLLAKFLKVTADMNAQYAKDSGPMMESISKAAGMDMEGTTAVIKTFVFPTLDEQLSDEWMGKTVAEYLTAAAAKLEEGGKIKALSDYSALVNTGPLKAAAGM